MNIQRQIVLMFSLILISVCCAAGQGLTDWGIPKDTLFNAEWRMESPTHYLVCIADFNGDGKKDTARILESIKGEGQLTHDEPRMMSNVRSAHNRIGSSVGS